MNEFIGKYVVVRANLAGVFAGILQSADKNPDGTYNVVLAESRQLWRWWAAVGQGTAGVAEHGLAKRSEVRVGAQMSNPKFVASAFQIDLCTATAEASIRQCEAVQ